jgi:TolB-like protein
MKKILLCLSIILVAIGCGYSKRYDNLDPNWSSGNDTPVGRFKTTYLAEQIHNFFRGSYSVALAVATFVDVDNLDSTSSFGRIMSEQLISELGMKGYTILEIRRADALQIVNGAGEFALSRNLSQLQKQYNLGGIVVGTYAVSSKRVYLNVRILDPRNSKILSVASAEIENNAEVQELLNKQVSGDVQAQAKSTMLNNMILERVPAAKLNAPKAEVSQPLQVNPTVPKL